MTTLKAETRSLDVKAKRLRREGYVPGIVFGKTIQGSIPVKMEQKDVDRLLKTETKDGRVKQVVEGGVYDGLNKEVAYDAMANQVVEIDFQARVSNEKVHSVAEIIFENHDKVETGVLQEVLKEVSYRELPAALVEKVQVDVGEMEIGDTIRVKDLSIAKDKDVDILTDLEAVVANVTAVHNNLPETDEEADAAEDT